MAAIPSLHLSIDRSTDVPGDAARRRMVLVAMTLSAVVAGVALATLAAPQATDPDLLFLLRAMAAIKAVLVAAALGVVAWRLGLPTAPRVALAYDASIAAMAFATALIAMNAFIGLAALCFHVALFTVLVAAWRDDGIVLRTR